MLSICFHAGGSLVSAESHDLMSKYINSKFNIRTKFYCYNYEIYQYLVNRGNECVFENKYKNRSISFSEQNELLNYLKQKNIVDFKDIYLTEWIIYGNRKKDENRLIQKSLRLLKFAKEILDDNFHADVFVDFAGNEIPHNVFRFVAKSSNARYIAFRETIFPDRLGLIENELGIWTIPGFSNITPNNEELEYISKFKVEYFDNKKIFWNDPKDVDIKLINTKSFKINHLFSITKIANFRFSMLRYFNKFFVKVLYNKLSDISSVNFHYFPLHCPDDSQLAYRGKPFIDQIGFAINLSRFLPFGNFLVVKEHPHARGFIAYSDLKRLKKIKNIILLDPWINSHEILPLAQVVCVINSTVAIEALNYGIPVISFGRSYLSGHNLVDEFKEFYDLFQLHLWKSKLNKVEIQNKLKEFLIQAYRYSYPLNAIELIQGKSNVHSEIRLIEEIIKYVGKDEIQNH